MKIEQVLIGAIVFLCCCTSFTALGQQTQSHHVEFRDMDGFSGYVDFITSREGFATQLYGRKAVLSLTNYACSAEELAALEKAGISFSILNPYKPSNFSVDVEGRGYVLVIMGDAYNIYSNTSKVLRLEESLGDAVVFEFNDQAKTYEQSWKKNHPNQSFWEANGGFKGDRVVALYLSDLKNEISKVLYELKQGKQRFSSLISTGNQAVNSNQFEAAESALAEAQAIAADNIDMQNQADDLKDLIAEKKAAQAKKEQEEKERKEQEEKEKQEAAQKAQAEEEAGETRAGSSTSSSGSSGHKDDKREDTEEEREESSSRHKVYIPKSNRQLYNELKAMTDRNPGMLNDPKIRAQLRGYKAYADRDDQNKAYYKAAFSGGNNHSAATYNAYAQAVATNQRAANVEVAIGGAVDGLTSMVNSIIAEKERQRQQAIAEEKQRAANNKAQWEALYLYDRKMAKQREAYVKQVKEELMEIYDTEYDNYFKTTRLKQEFSNTISNGAITYETEVPDRSAAFSDYGFFEKKTITLGEYPYCSSCGSSDDDDWLGNAQYNYLYIVSKDGKYGIVGDSGAPIYLPQFDEVYFLYSNNFHVRFLVKIQDKWGELFRDGSIVNEVKYDGIWYMPNGKKLLLLDDQWFEQSFRDRNDQEIKAIKPGDLVAVFKPDRNIHDRYTPILLSTKSKTIQNERITKEYVISEANNTKAILIQLNAHWYKQVYNSETQESTVERMPAVFVEKVRSEKADEDGKYSYGAINQQGRLILPIQYQRLTINTKNQTIFADNGQYDASGKLIQTVDLLRYNKVAQFDEVDKLWYIKHLDDKGYKVECGILDDHFNVAYKVNLSNYTSDQAEREGAYKRTLFSAYAKWLLSKGEQSQKAVDVLLALGDINVYYYKELGDAYFRNQLGKDKYSQAFQCYMTYLNAFTAIRNAAADALLNIGIMYQEGKGVAMDKQKALEYYQAGKYSSTRERDYSDWHYVVSSALGINIVECLIELKNFPGAKYKLKDVYKKSLPYYYLKGYMLEMQGNSKKAKSNYEKAIKLGVWEGTLYEALYKDLLNVTQARLNAINNPIIN